MYALRTQRWLGQYNPTGKPDGSFIRNDGLFTDNKASARLFETAEEAETYAIAWLADGDQTSDGQQIPLFLVEVEVKPVLHRMMGVVKLLVR